MKVIGFIPSRYSSIRLKAKPLALILGKTMIERVYENVKLSKKLDDLFVLTDDERIAKVVESFGGKFIFTSKDCNSGTERIISVLDSFDCDIALNVQGDEPLVNSLDIDSLVEVFKDENVKIATLIQNISDNIDNSNIVKVVLDNEKNGIYFSRAPIPYNRDNLENVKYYKHIGIYAYRAEVLKKFKNMHSTLDNIEKLEQLKFLENGYKIRTVETNNSYISIDIKEDLERLEKFLQNNKK